MTPVSIDRIQQAVGSIVAEIDTSIRQLPKTPPDEKELWTELTCCVLSSQVPYELARAAADRIRESGILANPYCEAQSALEKDLLALLSAPFAFEDGCRRYRFPNIRARQIAAAFFTVRQEFQSLTEFLRCNPDARSARAWLVGNLPGIGPKQASMFLRNAANSYDLAILDRHILDYMRSLDLSPAARSDVTTISKYERCERQLCEHAASLGYSVGLLDWAIWIVMRTASRIDRQ